MTTAAAYLSRRDRSCALEEEPFSGGRRSNRTQWTRLPVGRSFRVFEGADADLEQSSEAPTIGLARALDLVGRELYIGTGTLLVLVYSCGEGPGVRRQRHAQNRGARGVMFAAPARVFSVAAARRFGAIFLATANISRGAGVREAGPGPPRGFLLFRRRPRTAQQASTYKLRDTRSFYRPHRRLDLLGPLPPRVRPPRPRKSPRGPVSDP